MQGQCQGVCLRVAKNRDAVSVLKKSPAYTFSFTHKAMSTPYGMGVYSNILTDLSADKQKLSFVPD